MFQLLKSYLDNRYFIVKQNDTLGKLHPIKSSVPQGSVLGPVLYTLYTADLPTTEQTTTATYADDTAIIASHSNPTLASDLVQENLYGIQLWLKKWRIRINETKSVHITFTLRKQTCAPVSINGIQIPQSDSVKYLGMHLDSKLNWKHHIWQKRKQLGLQLRKHYWLLGPNFKLSLNSKVIIYKGILKPSGPMVSNSGARLPTLMLKSLKDSNQRHFAL